MSADRHYSAGAELQGDFQERERAERRISGSAGSTNSIRDTEELLPASLDEDVVNS